MHEADIIPELGQQLKKSVFADCELRSTVFRTKRKQNILLRIYKRAAPTRSYGPYPCMAI